MLGLKIVVNGRDSLTIFSWIDLPEEDKELFAIAVAEDLKADYNDIVSASVLTEKQFMEAFKMKGESDYRYKKRVEELRNGNR